MVGKESHMEQEQGQRLKVDLVGGILTLKSGSPESRGSVGGQNLGVGDTSDLPFLAGA